METVRNIEVKTRTWADAINTIYTMLPADYFWRVRTDGLFEVKQLSLEPDHIFTLGFDIISINREVRTSGLQNRYLGYNVNVGEPGHFTTTRTNVLSTLEYGTKDALIREPRFTGLGSMNAFLDRKLEFNSEPQQPFSMVISSSALATRGFDIESIRPGDTFKINNYIDTNLRLITKVTYRFDTVEIFTEDIREFVARRIIELEKKIDSVSFDNSPTVF
jgi:hypothetical protein